MKFSTEKSLTKPPSWTFEFKFTRVRKDKSIKSENSFFSFLLRFTSFEHYLIIMTFFPSEI